MVLLAVAMLLVLLAAAVVSYPLLFEKAEPYAAPPAPYSAYSERDALLDAIDDLEHSFHSGKLSQADYEAQRARLEAQYVTLLEAAEVGEGPRSGSA